MENVSLAEVRDYALQIGRTTFGGKRLNNVLVEEEFDSSGELSLSVTFVFNPKPRPKLSGGKLGKISLDLVDFLHARKDERFPYTHYATTDELKQLSVAE
ncbi:MAG: hypothetical protein ACREHE_16350 [Rhizomicrobium sp.]